MSSDESITVFNALWFEPGGAEKYAAYLKAARPLIEAHGGQVLDPVQATDAGEGAFTPDLMFFGRYPSRDALIAMLSSAEYQRIAPLRAEAVDRAVATLCRAADAQFH